MRYEHSVQRMRSSVITDGYLGLFHFSCGYHFCINSLLLHLANNTMDVQVLGSAYLKQNIGYYLYEHSEFLPWHDAAMFRAQLLHRSNSHL